MMLVMTKVDYSLTHQLGLFAAEPIPKGTVVWKYQEGFDRLLHQHTLPYLPWVAKQFVDRYFCFWRNVILVDGDDARFMNHSDDPNILADESGLCSAMKAVRNIAKGDELTANYNQFDDTWRKP
jgi:SET domain-containing protein